MPDSSAPVPSDVDPELVKQGRRAWQCLEVLHVPGYFAPETRDAYVELGLHPRLSYFASRAAAMGPVGPGVTVATFYVFAPWLVGRALPSAWERATPAQVVDARLRGMSAVLRRVLGEPDVTEALELARRATEGLTAAGRPLYAAHAELPWPEDDLLALWHAATLVREHRGDAHVSVLATSGLDPLESLVLGGLHADNTGFMKESRGWSEDEWEAACARLRERGLLDTQEGFTDAGRRLRQRVEHDTDALAVEGWAMLGVEQTRRLVELLRPLRDAVLGSDVLPGWLTGR